jgi:putative flippase GtrA
MKDKEEEKIKEVNSRTVRRKIKRGDVGKAAVNGKTVVLKKKPIPKEEVKKVVKEEKKIEPKKEEVKKKVEYPKNKNNKAPYVFFTVVSILYFAISICLIGYASYKAIAVARACKNSTIDTFVTEKMLNDRVVFNEDNVTIYEENHVGNKQVISYYFIVLTTFVITSFILAVIFSYLSEYFTDKRFNDPFKDDSIKYMKKCAYLAVSILCVSTLSAVLQKILSPFNISVVAIESVFVIAVATICGYIIIERGNEITKE